MIEYRIIKSNRKSVAIQIKDDCTVIVRAPKYLTKKQIEIIVNEKSDWILSTIDKVKIKQSQLENISYTQQDIINFQNFVNERVVYYSEIMNLSYGKVKFTNAKTRFGSCNTKTHNLCFSYMLMAKPKEAIEYVVVHELAHIIHPNHSNAFYEYIKKYMPDYKERKQKLK